jgi:hypothetical protein
VRFGFLVVALFGAVFVVAARQSFSVLPFWTTSLSWKLSLRKPPFLALPMPASPFVVVIL